ncbi:DUF1616 domain-containing protein [Thermosphaera chiliense]|uniref:DUF1616 domain-containing protein n=1 Tax=Thermosphaera chiliense TaxID=3402707 RepID=A0A7M1URJ3_9CREN|nr:DUF1616 domain-containing protein [Thermosphaera aggregans]QOR94890.1 DUF1616 domain-containing protein [Thermosphaera aggregans]
MIMDEEVFAVVLAVSIIGAVLGIALILRPENPEPFTAIGLLNQDCKIGEYPSNVLNGSTLDLCIYVFNNLGRTGYFKVVYKIATGETLPSNTTESPAPVLKEWRLVLAHNESWETPVKIPVYSPTLPSRVALVFELWVHNTGEGWVYTGRWVHLYVNVTQW